MAGRTFDLNEQGYRLRKTGIRPERHLVLIVCAGTTEEVYFNSYRVPYLTHEIHVHKSKSPDPENVVKCALAWIKTLGVDVKDGDFAWCVFDVDQYTQENIRKARSLATQYGINTSQSNPCFEVWYLLHFNYIDVIMTPGEAETRLKGFIKGYVKTRNYSDKVKERLQTALTNAKKLGEENGQNNPSTQVYDLIYKLLEIHRNSGFIR